MISKTQECNASHAAWRILSYGKVSEGGKRVFKTLPGDGKGRGQRLGSMKQGWDGQKITTAYPVSAPFESKRLLAQVC